MESQFHLPVGIIFSFMGMLLCLIIMWGHFKNAKIGKDKAKSIKGIWISTACLIACGIAFVFFLK